MLRTICLLITICLFVLIGGVQKLYAYDYQLAVESFTIEENSLTAKNSPVYDNNQQKCALVIISGMGDENLRFNVGNSFIRVDEKRNNGERVYLMWIPEGVVKVTISSDSKSFEPFEYYFNPRVKKAETYLMLLNVSKISTSIGKQYLEFVIEPADAYLEVNGEPWNVTEGIAYKQLPKGTYSYRIQAKDYHIENGVIEFKDLSTKQSVNIKLRPNYGWLNIDTPLSGVTVFIDNEMTSGDLRRIKLSSGQHTIRATKEMYIPFSQDIMISDGEETPFMINLKPNFSQVNIVTKDGADIYLDDKFVSNGTWSGPLSTGSYKVELKKDGYREYTEILSILKIDELYEFKFKSLVPIYGSVNIETNPPHANVVIDGKDYGKTPIYIPELLIGDHKMIILNNGYEIERSSFVVNEGQQTDLHFELKREGRVSTTSDGGDNSGDTPRPVFKGKKKYGCVNYEEVIKTIPQYCTFQQLTLSKTQEFIRKFGGSNYMMKDMKTAESQSETKEMARLNAEVAKLEKIISNAVNKIAAIEGLEIVFPTNPYPIGSPIYIGDDVMDITQQVIKLIK